jgi:hypothetical protein
LFRRWKILSRSAWARNVLNFWWFVRVADMRSFRRVQALLQSVDEMAKLIAELHDLRMRVQRAEATALARRHVAARKSGGAFADLTRRTVSSRPN